MTWSSVMMQDVQTWGLFSFTKAIILFGLGLLIADLCSKSFYKFGAKYISSQQIMLFKKIIYFTILTLFLVAALQELGFKLSVLLGSAGIATAAIAFASQTSISNIISGVFLIMEKTFQVGDQIRMGNTTGTITSIDLLSMKILTADHTLVRIPNETVIKSEIINITRFKKRRLVIPINVSYQANLQETKNILLNIAAHQPDILSEPEPIVVVESLAKSSVVLHLIVWAEQEKIANVKNNLFEQIKDALFIPTKIKYQKKQPAITTEVDL